MVLVREWNWAKNFVFSSIEVSNLSLIEKAKLVNKIELFLTKNSMIDYVVDTAILLSIYEASTKLLNKNVEFVQKAGLSNQQFIILIHLAKDPNLPYLAREKHVKPMMASELAESMGVSRANITNLLTVMIAKGLIKQVEDDKDRRIKRLTLTSKAEELIIGLKKGRLISNKENLNGFSEKEKEQFHSYLKRITENILNS